MSFSLFSAAVAGGEVGLAGIEGDGSVEGEGEGREESSGVLGGLPLLSLRLVEEVVGRILGVKVTEFDSGSLFDGKLGWQFRH